MYTVTFFEPFWKYHDILQIFFFDTISAKLSRVYLRLDVKQSVSSLYIPLWYPENNFYIRLRIGF